MHIIIIIFFICFFICTLYLPDPFHKSSFFYHYIPFFHDLPNNVLKYFCTLSFNMTCTM